MNSLNNPMQKTKRFHLLVHQSARFPCFDFDLLPFPEEAEAEAEAEAEEVAAAPEVAEAEAAEPLSDTVK